MKPRLLLTTRVTKEQLRRLSRLSEVNELSKIPAEELGTILPLIDLMLVNDWPSIITEKRLASMTNLKFIQSVYAGVNHIPFKFIHRRVIVCSNANAFSEEVAEYALGLVLAAAKRVVLFDSALKSGSWVEKSTMELGRDVIVLRGKVLGILGYGGVGRSVVRLARGFGMRIYAFARNKISDKGITAFYGKAGLSSLISRSDFIISTLPLNKFTSGLIGKRELSLMKKNATLVNVSRAEIIDERALFEHLAKNHSFTFATDVWWLKGGREVLKPGYPFFSLPNFIGTPHASGPSAAVTGRPLEFAIRNTIRFLKGLEPRNIVDRRDYS